MYHLRSVRCGLGLGHVDDGEDHASGPRDTPCRYQDEYQNRFFTCRQCYDRLGQINYMQCKVLNCLSIDN